MGDFKNCVSDLPGHRLGKYQWSFRSGICTADVEHIAFGKWAYFFAGMIMFAFVLSLFPLAVIREKVRWIRYALVDGAVFALVCLGINGVCRLKFEQKSSGRATCLIDHLLLCGRMRTWQEITCLLAMVVFILVIGAFVFSYASRQYAVKI